MNSILRICVPSILHVVAQHTKLDYISFLIYQSNLYFMIRFIILSGMKVYVNKNCEIYYSLIE